MKRRVMDALKSEIENDKIFHCCDLAQIKSEICFKKANFEHKIEPAPAWMELKWRKKIY